MADGDLSLIAAVKKFSDEAAAEAWFVERRWPQGIQCPYCDGTNISPRTNGRKTPAYRCNPCKRDFTVKTDTIMHDSKLPLSTWALAFHMMSTHPKGISSIQLGKDLGISQKSAWHLAHRIRETWDDQQAEFEGPVEVDETYIGGREKNKHADKKLHAGRGSVGKQGVAGARDRESGQVFSELIPDSRKETLHEFVERRTATDAMIYTDEHAGYLGLRRTHNSVAHSRGHYVDGDTHTNGIESHWAVLKRGYIGVYHWMSVKHLARYLREFDGRHNTKGLPILDQMSRLVQGSAGKRLPFAVLVAD